MALRLNEILLFQQTEYVKITHLADFMILEHSVSNLNLAGISQLNMFMVVETLLAGPEFNYENDYFENKYI
jgi:hypothetical protein